MWIQLSSGRGPIESSRAVALFYEKVLLPLLQDQNVVFEVISFVHGDSQETYRSLLLSISKNNDDLLSELKKMEGTIQWICQSPYRKNHKRKNWFFSIVLYEEQEVKNYSMKDISIKTTCGSGPGGQNVNKVATTVQLKHNPTGIMITAREERSQSLNKKLAFARLYKALEEKQKNIMNKKKSDLWIQHNVLKRGNAVLVYQEKKFILKE